MVYSILTLFIHRKAVINIMHKKKTSLIPLMDEDGLVSSDCAQDLELPGSSSIDEESGRASTSPTFLTRRYQKNASLCVIT